jgi:hypothetical protein
MRIEQLLENHKYSRKQLLKESCDGLTQQQRTIVENIYNEFVPLIEATLTADQVKDIFKGVEQAAVAGGDNRTLAGLGVDGAKKVNDIIDKAGKWLQDTTPVKNFDAKFEKLKNDINTKFPDSKILDSVSNLAIWVKDNPGKTAAVIGILTALASLAGGPVGGAIAGQVLKGATELLKGEKLSTAIGKGIKTAALGYLSGKAFEMLGNWVGGFREQAIPFGPKDAGLEKVNWGATQTITAPGLSSTETIQGFNITVFPEQREAVQQAMNAIRDGQAGGFDTLKTIAREINTPEYKSAISDIMQGARQTQLNNDSLLQWINGVAKAGQALSQGAVAGASTMPPKQESYYRQTRPLSEGQVYVLLKKIAATEQLNEGPMDWIKKGAAAVGKGIDRVGQNITNKVTYEKLLAGWKLDGSPMDSEELKKFLASMEVSPDIVNKVFTDMKIDATGAEPVETPAAASAYKQVKDQVLKLNTTQRKRIASYLQKQLGTA